MRTHRFEPASLVAGLVFLVAGLAFLSGDVDVWRLNWSWFWPVVLTIVGAVVLLSARSDTAARDVPEDLGDPYPPDADDRSSAPR